MVARHGSRRIRNHLFSALERAPPPPSLSSAAAKIRGERAESECSAWWTGGLGRSKCMHASIHPARARARGESQMAEQRPPGLTLQQRSLVLRCRGQSPLGMQQKGGHRLEADERLSGFASINSIEVHFSTHGELLLYWGMPMWPTRS